MSYAIISLGGKQFRVQEGQRLLVDRLPTDEGKTFTPQLLLLGGDGAPDLSPTGVTVTARVIAHVKGDKIRIGKYRPKTGYKRHNGFRASLSQIEIESIGKKAQRAKEKPAEANAETKTAGLPKGYEDMKVAEIAGAAPSWKLPALEAALAYEQEHGKRKGATAALESAIEAQKEND
ncbi:MAG TPA: 50S ribosomal protein L21 [Gaiellaceae bacterium]